MGVQRILRTTRIVPDKIFICIYGTEWKIIWVLGNKTNVRASTASQGKTWWSVEDFDYTVNKLNSCYECNTQWHVRRDCPSWGQPWLTYRSEEFNYRVNSLGYCWECNQPGYERIKCPDQGQTRTSYKGGQDEDNRCYNCNKCGHYSRDCLLPKRTRKEQRSWVLEETKKGQFFSSSFDVVHRKTWNQEKIICYIISVIYRIEWII